MKQLIFESQEGFQILKGVFKSKTGKEIPVFYLKGNTFDLHKMDDLRKKYGAFWDGNAKMWGFWQDRNDPQITIDTKIKPLIDRINNFYKYTLQLDELIAKMEDYTPTESDSNEVVPTKEEASQITANLKKFKDMLINIDNDEDFKSQMAAMIDFKAAQGYPYSLANVILIKTQRPNATNVNSAKDWKDAYKRTVNEGAKPIFIWKPMKGWKKSGDTTKVQQDFLRSAGKTSVNDLNPGQKMQLKKDMLNTSKGGSSGFYLVGHYDVSDTTQIEGTEDYIEKARNAATKVNLDTDTSNIVSDEIKPIYSGLVKYAESQNIGINSPNGDNPNIAVPQNAGNDAKITKGLAKNILNEILHKTYLKQKGGFASKLHVGGDSNAVIGQQSEIAAWMFMYAFGIDFKTSQIDLATIWGNDKNNMETVFNTVSKAVNHLIDFVNVSINDSKGLNEMGGGAQHGKHITPDDIARMLGVQKQFKDVQNASNQANLQELYKRLMKKVIK
jgi:hypothetical protein